MWEGRSNARDMRRGGCVGEMCMCEERDRGKRRGEKVCVCVRERVWGGEK